MKKQLYNEIMEKQNKAIDFDFPITISKGFVLVDVVDIKPEEKTDSGIYIPDTAITKPGLTFNKEEAVLSFKEHPWQAVIVKDMSTDATYKAGQYIYMRKDCIQYGQPILLDEHMYLLINSSVITGVVDLTKIKIEE